jgi:hypothetical protein
VSQRSLRECCTEHLGMGPSRYRCFCAMQQVHRALRRGNFGHDEGLASRRAIRLPWSRPFRHPLSGVIRRITLGHFAASLKSGRRGTRPRTATRETFVTALTRFNR